MQSFLIHSNYAFNFLGPNLEEGPLPAIFYFATSGKDSLSVSPFSLFPQAFAEKSLRIFSISLPEHEEGKDPLQGIPKWGAHFAAGIDCLTPFFELVKEGIHTLIEQRIVDKNKILVAGLSRGVFIAAHIAARMQTISSLLGFAPLTDLAYHAPFDTSKIDLTPFSLHALIPHLYKKRIRFYIGNRDTKVSTNLCYQFIEQAAEYAYTKRIRSAPFELMIRPSIGYGGHGTSKEVFKDGALWAKQELDL